MIEKISTLLPVLSLVGLALLVCLLIYLATRLARSGKASFGLLADHGLELAFLTALLATLGSLFYSEIMHYEPCKLCWLQRIFMYPQVILLGIAFWKKDRHITRYIIPLATLGALIAAYHYAVQIGLTAAVSCGVVGYSASCSQFFVLQYGFITIPMMSLIAFSLIVINMVIVKTNLVKQ